MLDTSRPLHLLIHYAADYHARMAQGLGSDMALAATSIWRPSRVANFAVMYGCNEGQEAKIKERLRDRTSLFPNAIALIDIFAEIHRDCLVEHVEDLLDRFVQLAVVLRKNFTGIATWRGELAADLLSYLGETRDLIRHLQDAKVQVGKMIEHVAEFDRIGPTVLNGGYTDVSSVKDMSDPTRSGCPRIREKLLEIGEEYDGKIEDCKMVLQDLTVMTQIVSAPISNHPSIDYGQ